MKSFDEFKQINEANSGDKAIRAHNRNIAAAKFDKAATEFFKALAMAGDTLADEPGPGAIVKKVRKMEDEVLKMKQEVMRYLK